MLRLVTVSSVTNAQEETNPTISELLTDHRFLLKSPNDWLERKPSDFKT
jgi:hypothetical protein